MIEFSEGPHRSWKLFLSWLWSELPDGPLSSNNLRVDGVLHNWEASLLCVVKEEKKVLFCVPPSVNELKFNVDGAARKKPNLAGMVGCSIVVKELCWLYFPSM